MTRHIHTHKESVRNGRHIVVLISGKYEYELAATVTTVLQWRLVQHNCPERERR